jgi:tetratricopeptide (TPR) repeat protein
MGSRTLVSLECLLALCLAISAVAQDSSVEAAKNAFERGEYAKVISILEPEAAKNVNNGELYLLLSKSYLQVNQVDPAIKSAERAVSIDPKNSVYHDWLGQAYGEKASHASMFSAYPLARKTQKEFETAVSLDEHNYEAAQNLVEYDCTAPGVVGGGADKAQPIIQKLMTLDASQGHYAQANCLLQKKDKAGTTEEFLKALGSKPKSIILVSNIADYFVDAGEGDHLLSAVSAGETIAPSDPRFRFYRAVAWILKKERPEDAESLLREYLQGAPHGSDYPSPSVAHYWIGRLYESQKNITGARAEYQAALKINPKYKNAQDAVKKLGGN